MSDAANPYAPPKAAVGDVKRSSNGLELASRWRRLGAALIDYGICLPWVYLLTSMMGISLFSEHTITESLLESALWTAIFLVINGWLLVKRGQSVGKMILGIRIVRPDGSAVDPWRMIGLRCLAPGVICSIPVIGPALAIVNALWIFGRARRCLHDLLADTIVIKL